MKKMKPELAVCLSAFCSFCILCGMGSLLQAYPLVRTEIGVLLAEAVAFVPAILLLQRFAPNAASSEPAQAPRRRHPTEIFLFVCASGAAVTFLSFLLNYLVYFLTALTDFSLDTAMVSAQNGSTTNFGFFSLSILVPALLEELYLRGILQSILKTELNQLHLVLFSGFLFALLHGSLQNFVGPFVAGVFYSWLVCVFGSVWYAVAAHCIHNALFRAISWLMEFFSTFGIWSRFPAISLILFLLFLYIALRFAERLAVHRCFLEAEPKENSHRFMGKLFGNVGMIALLFAYIAKAVFGII